MNEDRNILSYLNAVNLLKSWLAESLISDIDFIKMEEVAASKFCIKNINIYRLNNLINSPFRAIYVTTKKEA